MAKSFKLLAIAALEIFRAPGFARHNDEHLHKKRSDDPGQTGEGGVLLIEKPEIEPGRNAKPERALVGAAETE